VGFGTPIASSEVLMQPNESRRVRRVLVIAEGLLVGVFGYLPKPMDLRYVAHLVDLALRRRARDTTPPGGRR
jgi:hypothetical protein